MPIYIASVWITGADGDPAQAGLIVRAEAADAAGYRARVEHGLLPKVIADRVSFGPIGLSKNQDPILTSRVISVTSTR